MHQIGIIMQNKNRQQINIIIVKMLSGHSQIQETENDTSHPQSLININQSMQQIKDQRKKLKKKIFGQHYNYNYRKPQSHTLNRAHQHRYIEIQRQNKILLEKIQSIFRKPTIRKNIYSTSHMQSIQNQDQLKNQQQSQELKQMKSENAININRIKLRKIQDTPQYGLQMSKSLSKNQNIKDNAVEDPFDKQSFIKIQKNQFNQIENKRTKRIKTQMNQNSKKYIQRNNIKLVPTMRNLNPEKQKQIKNRQSEPRFKKSVEEPRIMLFDGHRHISGIMFNFRIYMHGKKYIIQSDPVQRNGKTNMKIQQKIKLPYSDYRKIYTKYLQQDHAKIFSYIWVSKLSSLLQFVGIEKQLIEAVEYQTHKLQSEQSQKQQLKQQKIMLKPNQTEPINIQQRQIDQTLKKQSIKSEVVINEPQQNTQKTVNDEKQGENYQSLPIKQQERKGKKKITKDTNLFIQQQQVCTKNNQEDKIEQKQQNRHENLKQSQQSQVQIKIGDSQVQIVPKQNQKVQQQKQQQQKDRQQGNSQKKKDTIIKLNENKQQIIPRQPINTQDQPKSQQHKSQNIANQNKQVQKDEQKLSSQQQKDQKQQIN